MRAPVLGVESPEPQDTAALFQDGSLRAQYAIIPFRMFDLGVLVDAAPGILSINAS